jgi:hypothetical protein
VADVEEAVRLGREPGDHPAAVATGAEVVLDDVREEVLGARAVAHGRERWYPSEARGATSLPLEGGARSAAAGGPSRLAEAQR